MRLPVPDDVMVPPELREPLAFHIISEHANLAAMDNTPEDNLQYHLDDHFGPCGIRNHDWTSFHYDEDKLEIALEEAEEAELGLPRTQ
jgi:hypothetical protein